jgi:hypothetical protein
MRFLLAAVLAIASLVVAVGCGTAGPGWQGTGVHLIDGVWIGTERDCRPADDDRTCRAVIAEAMRVIGRVERSKVVRAQLAELPTTFATASGETRTARVAAGIMARTAVVLDLADGSRRVVGLWCHAISVPTCELDVTALEYWIDGAIPPSYPPGAVFG